MKYRPQLAKIGTVDDLDREGYIFEPKLDGIRALCHVNKTMRFYTRNDINVTSDYPEFKFRKNIKAKNCILDGEIVIYGKRGVPSFHLWQLRKEHDIDAVYVVFDILEKNGKSLLKKPLWERKEILEDTIKEGSHLEIIPYTTNGKKLWKEVRKRGLEGVVAKDDESKYLPGKRQSIWLKVKIVETIDCIIIGFTQKKRIVSSLALGLYKGKNIQFIGKVGTGFSEKFLKKLYPKLERLISAKPTVINPPRSKLITWLKPKLVAEIKYAETTKDQKLRAPVFLRLRDDKKAKQCTFRSQWSS